MLAHLLLMQVHSYLLKYQIPEQSGLTPSKSTTDRILALRVLVQHRREFRQGIIAAYINLEKAFDLVLREALWDFLRLCSIPARIIGQLSRLYSGTESAVKCVGSLSSFFPVHNELGTGQSYGPVTVEHLLATPRSLILCFVDDAVISAESLEVLMMALEALHEEAKPLELQVSWLKTKVQVFGSLLHETGQSIHACGEDIDILDSFTYLGSVVHNNGGSCQEVLQRIGLAYGVMDSLSTSIWGCRYLCRRTKIRIFKTLVIPLLLHGCETWTLNTDPKRQIDVFGNKCLRRIMGYRWNYFLSNQRLLRETESRSITSIVGQRHIGLYGNVARSCLSGCL